MGADCDGAIFDDANLQDTDFTGTFLSRRFDAPRQLNISAQPCQHLLPSSLSENNQPKVVTIA